MQKNKKSLYTTYRPATFNSVAGHKNVIEILQKQLNENKISHALLFAGQRGTGKTSVARIFAKAVNCKDAINGISCEVCESCVSANEFRSPDIFEIDAASNNGVDEIRGIKNNVSTLPLLGNYKIYIIDEVHMLTKAAFNALLKTLEEPPAHALFILATTEYAKIPATIVSRCQTFNFKKIDKDSLIARLKFVTESENYTSENQVFDEIFYLSEGSLRDALNILEQIMIVANENAITIDDLKSVFYVATKKEKLEILKNVLMGESTEVIRYFESAENQGMDFDVFALSLIEIVKEIIEYKLVKSEEFLRILELKDVTKFDTVDMESLFRLADNLGEAYAKTKGTSINFNYLLINLLKSIGNHGIDFEESIQENDSVQDKPIIEIKEEVIVSETIAQKPEAVELVEPTIREELIVEEPKVAEIVAEQKTTESVEQVVAQEEEQPPKDPSIKTGSDLIEMQSIEIIRSGNIDTNSIEVDSVINLLVSAKKDLRDMIDAKINSWFRADEQNNLINPEKAEKFFAFYNVKISAVSGNEILVNCETLSHSKLINHMLESKKFREELFAELGKEVLVYPIDKNKWEDVKTEFKTLKVSNSLPEHKIFDVNQYYQDLTKQKLQDNNQSELLEGASKLFDLEDIKIGE
ncbi:DNA polymerase III subunit gamma/tau [[Acholeplasma] multilocale]|uniref:DNA polymerase III subunit gamma/tau n=1 Tax=[Acholeplasma] multilocale TaxID=264638 RepID=UPI00047D3DD4|nr:DNA polymerase III subunit gamma/tau [[Acholeplasma] multilocale]